MIPNRRLSHPGLPDPPGFSRAVLAAPGATIHLAGQLAFGADGAMLGEGDVAAQATACMERIVALLAQGGATCSDLVSLQVHTTSRPALAAVREVLAGYVDPAVPPAITGVAVAELADARALVEISGVAVVPNPTAPHTPGAAP